MGLIQLTDSPVDVIAKMSRGNNGAAKFIATLHIIPGGLSLISLLDELEIYGEEIYFLFDEVCKLNYKKFQEVLILIVFVRVDPENSNVRFSDIMQRIDKSILTDEVIDKLNKLIYE